MKQYLYFVIILLGLVLSLFVSTIWIDFFIRVFFVPTDDVLNILVLGLDKEINGAQRTDVILLMKVDTKDRKVYMSSIPRDLMIEGRKINSYYVKEGLVGIKKRVEELTSVNISKYVIVDYEIFQYLGDELGPIEVFVDQPMHYKDVAQNLEVDFSPGYYKMDGQQLLAYLRFRKTAEGDIARLRKQAAIVEKIAQKLLQKDVFEITRIYREVRKRTETDVDIGEVVYLLTKFRSGIDLQTIPFPFYIGQDGNLYVDEKNIELYRESFASGEKKLEATNRFYVIYNGSKKNLTTSEKIKIFWKEKFGQEPSNIFIEGVNAEFRKNTAMILSKDRELFKKVENAMKEIYGEGNYDIYFTEDRVDYVVKYMFIISELTKTKRMVRFPIDFIVVQVSN